MKKPATATLLTAATLSAFSLQPSGFCSAAASPQPNIIFILADDIGYGDLSCYGATLVRTPNADRLAATGLRFTNAHCAAASCTPSRYALLTGEYSFRRDDTGIAPGNAASIIRPTQKTVQSMLQSAGYTTAVVGKWHLGLGNDTNQNWNDRIAPGPKELGFDYSFIFPATGDRVPCVYLENQRVVNLDPADPIEVSYTTPFPNEPLGKDHPELLTNLRYSNGHASAIVNGISRIGYQRGGRAALWKDETIADTITAKAVAFIDRAAAAQTAKSAVARTASPCDGEAAALSGTGCQPVSDIAQTTNSTDATQSRPIQNPKSKIQNPKPFFLYFATHDIHVPRWPNPRFLGKTPMGLRGDAIAQLDWSIGQILDALDRHHLTENTIIILTSDNGPVLDDGYQDRAVELLGTHKPAGPLRGGKGSSFEGGTRVPFILSWPAGGVPQNQTPPAPLSHVDFYATMAALTSQPLPPDAAPDSLNQLPAWLGKTQTGRPYIMEHARVLSIVEGDWKYIVPSKQRTAAIGGNGNETGTSTQPQLYNLRDDLGERTNLAPQHPARVAALSAQIQQIQSTPKTRPPK